MSVRPDLLLVNPGGRRRIYQSLGDRLAAIENPVWAGLLASFVRGRGHSVEILDANAENLDAQATAARIEEIDPRLTAVVVYGHNPSASTQVMPSAGAICRAAKACDAGRPVLLLGGHVAALAQRTLDEEAADFTCDGEGPYTLTGLIEALCAGVAPDDIRVPGLVTRARRTPDPAPLVQALDTQMPGDAWDLLPMERYRAHNWHAFGGRAREPYVAIYTTLGCPFKCAFCCIQAPFKSGESALGIGAGTNSYRYWTPDHVVTQIDHLVDAFGVRNIKFADELFVLNRRYVEAICDRLVERDHDLNIWAYARIDSVRDERLIAKLRAAGITWLALGIEAGNEAVREGSDKGVGQALIYATVERLRAAGISVVGNFIFGLPHDTGDTMQETLDLALDLRPEYVNFYSAMAYPGSALYERAVARGWPLPDTWSGYSQFSRDTLPLPTETLTGGEVLAFRDHAFDVYHRDPGYLAMMARRFGPQAAAEIRDMTSHRLEREHAAASPLTRTED